MQAENNKMKQLSKLVRQVAKQVVTQMELPGKFKDESYSNDLQRCFVAYLN